MPWEFDPEGRTPNMGPIQGGVRILGGILLVPTILLLTGRVLPIDWAFTLVLHGLLTGAYLLITGVGRFDPFFGALVSMWRRGVRAPREARRRRVAARPAGPRGPARPQ